MQVLAHTSGKSLEQEVNGFLVDVGFDSEIITENTPLALDFSLVDKAGNKDVDFDSVWLTIKNKDETIFASGIEKAKLGRTTMLYTFPQSGNYTLSLRFMKEDFAHTQASFPLTIETMKEDNNFIESNFLLLLGTFIGVLVGGIFTLWFKKTKK